MLSKGISVATVKPLVGLLWRKTKESQICHCKEEGAHLCMARDHQLVGLPPMS